MADEHRAELSRALLELGLSRRHVRRIDLEIQAHVEALVQAGLASGLNQADALAQAYRQLGPNDLLVRRYAAHPELRALPRRRPALVFAVLPILAFCAAFATLCAVTVAALSLASESLHQRQISAAASAQIADAARILALWLLPTCIAALFAALARRHRLRIGWPLLAVSLICLFAALMNVDLNITGGAAPGSLGAGIGFSTQTLLPMLLHAGSMAAAVVMPLWLVYRRDHTRSCRRT